MTATSNSAIDIVFVLASAARKCATSVVECGDQVVREMG